MDNSPPNPPDRDRLATKDARAKLAAHVHELAAFVAPDARGMFGVVVCGDRLYSFGAGEDVRTAALLEICALQGAYELAAGMGVPVINLSIGDPVPEPGVGP